MEKFERSRTMGDDDIEGVDAQVPVGEVSLTTYVDSSLRSHHTVIVDRSL
jgi:hypothetical protein